LLACYEREEMELSHCLPGSTVQTDPSSSIIITAVFWDHAKTNCSVCAAAVTHSHIPVCLESCPVDNYPVDSPCRPCFIHIVHFLGIASGVGWLKHHTGTIGHVAEPIDIPAIVSWRPQARVDVTMPSWSHCWVPS